MLCAATKIAGVADLDGTLASAGGARHCVNVLVYGPLGALNHPIVVGIVMFNAFSSVLAKRAEKEVSKHKSKSFASTIKPCLFLERVLEPEGCCLSGGQD